MLAFSQTLHRHDPAPAHLRIHLVHPSSNLPGPATTETVGAAPRALSLSLKFLNRAAKISGLVITAPAIGAIIYWARHI
jgi:hypothetical protein